MKLVAASRSGHKLREIRAILREVPGIELVCPDAAGVPLSAEEEGIEIFETFEENSLAKARYFHERTGLPTLADDSGLEVDALAGAPGVRSKRFAPIAENVTGLDRDRANNQHLLGLMEEVPSGERGARFVCVAVVVGVEEDPIVVRGEAEGVILPAPRGEGGFGYDPLFFDPLVGKSFAELSAEEKDARSHRGKAFREMGERLG